MLEGWISEFFQAMHFLIIASIIFDVQSTDMTKKRAVNHANKRLIIKFITHSNCTGSKARSLPWILVIVLPKVENC
jgi:hypothetical protein